MSRFSIDPIPASGIQGVNQIANNLIQIMQESGRNERHSKELKQRQSEMQKQLEEAAKNREFQGQQNELNRMAQSADYQRLNESKENIAQMQIEASQQADQTRMAFQEKMADADREFREKWAQKAQEQAEQERRDRLEIARATSADERAAVRAQIESQYKVAEIMAGLSATDRDLSAAIEADENVLADLLGSATDLERGAELAAGRVQDGMAKGFENVTSKLIMDKDGKNYMKRLPTGEKPVGPSGPGGMAHLPTRPRTKEDLADSIIELWAEGAANSLSKSGQVSSGATKDAVANFMKTLAGIQAKYKADRTSPQVSAEDQAALAKAHEALIEVMDETNVRPMIQQFSQVAGDYISNYGKNRDAKVAAGESPTFNKSQDQLFRDAYDDLSTLDDMLVATSGSQAYMTYEHMKAYKSVVRKMYASKLRNMDDVERFFENDDTLPPSEERKLADAFFDSGFTETAGKRRDLEDRRRQQELELTQSQIEAGRPLDNSRLDDLFGRMLDE